MLTLKRCGHHRGHGKIVGESLVSFGVSDLHAGGRKLVIGISGDDHHYSLLLDAEDASKLQEYLAAHLTVEFGVPKLNFRHTR